jgi:hypothetical protein
MKAGNPRNIRPFVGSCFVRKSLKASQIGYERLVVLLAYIGEALNSLLLLSRVVTETLEVGKDFFWIPGLSVVGRLAKVENSGLLRLL